VSEDIIDFAQDIGLPGYPYELSRDDHAFFEQQIHKRCGIVLGWNKAPMMARRLSRRLRHLGLTGFADYRAILEAHPNGEEWDAVISALTTNKTSFFREMHHFKLLEDTLKTAIARGQNRIRLWSAACATGEEAYSMAMTARNVLGNQPIDFKILATDIDPEALASAQAGEYELDAADGVPRFARSHFAASDDPRRLRVNPSLREDVVFKRLNLIANDWPMRGPFLMIFCRNVLIYFDRNDQTRVVRRMMPLLEPHGYLCLGHAEVMPDGDDDVRRGPVSNSYARSGFDQRGLSQ
jgi:chemotaxis protein methyltransferase CheR